MTNITPRFLAQLWFALTLGLACVSISCSGTSDNSVADKLYIRATVNSAAIDLTDGGRATGIVPTYGVDGKVTANDSFYIAINQQRLSYYDVISSQLVEVATKPMLQITFVKTFEAKPIKSDIDPIVQLGSMPYGNELKEIDGVEIAYRDSAGTRWSSTFGSGLQTGSVFNVSGLSKLVYFPGQVAVGHYVATGSFNCMLYDSLGNSAPLSNGSFSIRAVHYLPF